MPTRRPFVLTPLSIRPAGSILVLILVIAGKACAQELPAKAIAVLKRFEGEWTTQTEIRHLGLPERVIETRGRATCRRTLEGRFFEFRARTEAPEQSDLQVMTYDVDAGVYRQWVFSSDGYTHEAAGAWDAATSTLRWTGRSGKNQFVIDDHWASPDRLEWTLRKTDPQGTEIQAIRGTVERITPQNAATER